MSKFLVTAKDMSGRIFNEVVEADASDRAVQEVQAKGLFVTGVKKQSDLAPAVRADISQGESIRKFTRGGVSLEDIVSFARQLATMIEAGVPLLRSLTVISQQVESRELANVLDAAIRDVEQGQSFSRALSKYPKVFSPFWVSLVEVGEASGTMPKVLLQLTLYMEQEAAFRSAILGAMVYPMVLCFICSAAILFFAIFIGPTFEKIFNDMHATLPGITTWLLFVFKVVKEKFILLAGGIAAAVFMFKGYVSAGPGRRQFEAFLFRLPVFGKTIKLIVVEKFTSQMAILVDSGVPILYALEISERLVDNLICAEVIKRIREGVREGRLLAEPMEQSGFFPPMAVQMIRVGEETGELGKMLNHVAVYYKKNIETFMKAFGSVIEPVMLVFMGSIIGVIVTAMFMPILTLATG